MDLTRSLDGVPPDAADATDEQLVVRALEGDVPAFTLLMRRYNRRLFRVARGVLSDDTEAEDACQEAWLRAYVHLEQLQRGAAFSTWLCRIGRRCALERAPRRRRVADGEVEHMTTGDGDGPENHAEMRRIASATERALAELTPSLREVVVLRELEELSTGETAAMLGVTEETVRVRLHRGRAWLRERIADALGAEVFAFDGERCDRMVGAVVRRIYSDETYATRSACSVASSPRPMRAS